MNRVMIAAPSSATGKTTLTCGLLQALKNRKLELSSFKCGPDYIDPMFHSKVIGIPSMNLDLFFQTEEEAVGFFCQNQTELSVIEGVMGYYDGIAGTTDRASSYHLAAATKTPVILVVSPKGQSLSVVALIRGFMDFRKDSNICGVILNKCSRGLYELLKPVIEEQCVPVLGYLPELAEISLESRHLGLVTADEVEDIEQKLAFLAQTLEETVDIEAILQMAASAPKLCGKVALPSKIGKGKVVAVAKDEAFCFYYKDNLDLLRELGCEVRTFSPLKDENLPENTSCIYIGGGYPELYTKQLASNTSMLECVREAAQNGVPILAECGGFMYLLEDITGEKMVGALRGSSMQIGRLVRFGYVELQAQEDSAFIKKGEHIKGHEFHHWDSTNNGALCIAKKPISERNWPCMRSEGKILAGFPHLFFRNNEKIVRRFVECGK